MTIRILALLFSMLMTVSTMMQAEQGISLLPSKEVKFLPVEEAYDYSFYLDENELVLDWIITPEYYLYKDKFKYSAPSDVVTDVRYLDTWVEKYDPTFDQFMPLYYEAMSVRLELANEPEQFEMQVVYQGCADAGLCYPPQKLNLNVNQLTRDVIVTTPVRQSAPTQAAPSKMSFAFAILFAFIGGMILNLMPCVFPVLSLKAIAIAESGHDIDERRLHASFYMIGVVISFAIVGLVPVMFAGVGEWVGWGFQLQSPVTIGLLLVLFFILSLNMLGWLEFGTRFMGMGQHLTEKKGVSGSFFTGVLATLVATPCVAPFMGSAIGYALTQPLVVSLTVFVMMGFGMALPLVLVAWIPAVGKMLPKPGAWMDHFKQFMAFPLLLTVLWLLTVLAEMNGISAVLLAGSGLLLITLIFWPPFAIGKAASEAGKSLRIGVKILLWALALGLILKPAPQASPWQVYSPQLISDYQDAGIPVFVDVTAAWCITCKVNEKVAMSSDRFFNVVAQKGIQLVKADWTSPSPEVDRLIEQYGVAGVPLYLLIANGRVEVLPQILTPETLLQYFDQV